LRAKLTNFFNEVAYEPGLWSLPHVRCAKRIDVPTLGLTACHQGTNASDLVQRVLWEAIAEGLSQFGIGGAGRSSILAAAARSATVSRSQTMTDCSGMGLKLTPFQLNFPSLFSGGSTVSSLSRRQNVKGPKQHDTRYQEHPSLEVNV
jgi:hypothetical protein